LRGRHLRTKRASFFRRDSPSRSLFQIQIQKSKPQLNLSPSFPPLHTTRAPARRLHAQVTKVVTKDRAGTKGKSKGKASATVADSADDDGENPKP